MRAIDRDPVRPATADSSPCGPGDAVPTGPQHLTGRTTVTSFAFDDDEELEPTIVRGRE